MLISEAARVKELGTIEVVIEHTQLYKMKDMDSSPSLIGFVSEKVLKGRAISHSVG